MDNWRVLGHVSRKGSVLSCNTARGMTIQRDLVPFGRETLTCRSLSTRPNDPKINIMWNKVHSIPKPSTGQAPSPQ